MANIVIADDEGLIRNVLRQILELDGFAVTELPDGRDVVAQCRKVQAELAIIDLIMPDQEGLSTISALRAAIPEIRIIAMSGGGKYVGTDYLAVAMHMGANRTITKPFERRAILNIIHELLDDTEADNSVAG